MVKRFTKHIFFTISIMIIVVFVTGLLLGRHLERSQESEISNFLKENELITESYLIEQDLIRVSKEKGCDLAKKRIDVLSNQLGVIGQRLSVENSENILGKTDYNFLKRRYHLMQIRIYLMYQQIKDRCGLDRDIILFYYGNDNGVSKEQGEILDDLVKKEQSIVFAVEYNYSKELNFLEYYYNVTSTPVLVLNYNVTLDNLSSYETILGILTELRNSDKKE